MVKTMKRDDFYGLNSRLFAYVSLSHNGELAGVSAVLWSTGQLNVCVCVTENGKSIPAQTLCSRNCESFNGGFFVGGKDFTITVKNGRLFVR